MIKKITFITGNAAKAAQLGRHLDFSVNHQKIELTEIQSLDVREVVEHKVKEAFYQTKSPVLVEDTSLIFNALSKLPGPLIKWFLQELGNEGLCRLLDGFSDRSAVAEVCFGLYDGKEIKYFYSLMKGEIAKKPIGEAGFGWDPIFIPDGYIKTWAEMSDEEQKNSSLRRKAAKQLEEYLQQL